MQFAVYVFQQLMLVGLTLPIWALHFPPAPSLRTEQGYYADIRAADVIIIALCVTGIAFAAVADTQLHDFTNMYTTHPNINM